MSIVTKPFALHPRLAADTLPIAELPLCSLLLFNDSSYPWCILVPRRAGMREIFELNECDQQQLLRETSWLASQLTQQFAADKINIATIGNIVSQLHIHVVARYNSDPAWPAPVWGRAAPICYQTEAAAEVVRRIGQNLLPAQPTAQLPATRPESAARELYSQPV